MPLILTGAAGSTTLDSSAGLTFSDSSNQQYAASPYVLKNRIINGAMVIDQRNAGASVTNSAGATTYTLDRWALYGSQASKFSVQQNAGSVTPPAGFTNYLGVTSLSAYSVGASELFVINQRIEGYNLADFSWGTADAKTITISFWVRSSLTGTFGGVLQNSAQNRNYPFNYSISSANTWEQKTITVTGDTTGTWLTTNGIGLRVSFSIGVGSTLSGTAGAWSATEYYSATGATSIVGTNGATWYITGVQLEVGSTATPFERRLYGQELANCQRYYWILAKGNQVFVGNALYLSSTELDCGVNFPVAMRVAPSLVQNTGTNYYQSSANADSFDGFTTAELGMGTNPTICNMYAGSNVSGTTGYATHVRTQNASALISFSSEL